MRIIACKAWYAGGREFQGDFSDHLALADWWRGLPDDGALGYRLWFNKKAPVRLGRIVSGNPWYFLLATADPSIDGYDGEREELLMRYPEAIPKRGKLVGEREIYRFNRAIAKATYWGD